MDEGLLALFEGIKQDFLTLALDDFTNKRQTESHKINILPAISGTPLESDLKPFQDAVNTAANIGFPLSLREDAYKRLKYKVDEIIAKIKSGSASLPRRKIAEEVVNKISDPKIKQICLEINTTPDQNVLSLAESLGEAIKWTLWYRAQSIPGAVQALGKNRELSNLLDKATDKNQPYYSDPSEKAAHRFLEVYKNSFYKTSYDMVRHDPTFIPTILVLNPAFEAFEYILKVTFP
jgi:hypothetical protein